MSQPMYRAHIVDYPETETRLVFRKRAFTAEDGGDESIVGEYMSQVPRGWNPTQEYVDRFNTNDWIEPDTDKWFKSRTPAANRVKILNDAGYTAIVQRSAPVEWPKHGEEKVIDTDMTRVLNAIGVLKLAGLIDSADDLIK